MSNETYLNKITSQHTVRPKLMQWAETLMGPADSIAKLLNAFDENFDIHKSVGAQQDIVGQLVGRERSLDWQPSDGSNPRLEDDLYRIVQLAKVSINQWDGTISGVVELWRSLFPEYQIIIEDNQDMTMNLSIIGLTTAFEKELMAKGYIAPKPATVRIVYRFYDHLYRIEQSSFFVGITTSCPIYSIDAQAKLAEDTVVYAKQHMGMARHHLSHVTVNSKATATDTSAEATPRIGASHGLTSVMSIDSKATASNMEAESSQTFGIAKHNLSHVTIDGKAQAGEHQTELGQNQGSVITGTHHYVIEE